jgi:cell wall-associated NlpC family hydrolase
MHRLPRDYRLHHGVTIEGYERKDWLLLFNNKNMRTNTSSRLYHKISCTISLALISSITVFLGPNAASARSHKHHSQYHTGHAARHKAAAHAPRPVVEAKPLVKGNVVQAAYQLRGTRYVMGGTSRSGFDCSGFVRYILSHSGGVDLPRTATEQYYRGRALSRAELSPGDLVFFKNTYKHGISHVGIYSGDGKFIHAANSHKGVRMDSLDAPYYANHYAGARRVLPADMLATARLR